MANKRMFSKQITTSDAFVDMPVSSQLLYFHLNMEADDDGFVANPKRLIRMLNVGDDDFKILATKRFILTFGSGVIVIKHWLLHNAVRKDMYKETQYLDEKNTLEIKENGVYTELRNESVTKPLHRLDKIRLDKDRIDYTKEDFENFWLRYPRKIGKPLALKSWLRLSPVLSEVLTGLEKWLASSEWKDEGGKFVPYPATFLNQERWKDEPRTIKSTTIKI